MPSLNPVRVGRLGLSKADRARQQTAAAKRSEPRLIRERLKVLVKYPWSSYPIYVGKSKPVEWLKVDRVSKALGGRSPLQKREALREYTEAPLREGRVDSPWSRLIGGVVLGSEEFVAQLRQHATGSVREQRALKLYEEQVGWDRIVKAVESVKGEKWEVFRDRHGDWGRDAALYFGRKQGRMKLLELSAAVGDIDYGSVAGAISRFGKRVAKGELCAEVKRVKTQLSKT